jgi:hypothetical protein
VVPDLDVLVMALGNQSMDTKARAGNGRHRVTPGSRSGAPVRGVPFRRVRPVTGTGFWSACMTKQPRSALRTTLATRSGGSGVIGHVTCRRTEFTIW